MMDEVHHVSQKQGSVPREEYRPKLAYCSRKHVLEVIGGPLAVRNQTECALCRARVMPSRVGWVGSSELISHFWKEIIYNSAET